ncbi:von Willebrand factor type A domain-containing protein [Flavobacteriaceae bacterium 3-367]
MKKSILIAIVLSIGFVVKAQEKTITGTISDATGPLPGVSVIVKKSIKRTYTNFDGNYSILTSKGDTLVFSYIGFKTREVLVGDAKVINLLLEQDSSQLDEVIVVGHGISTKRSITASVTQVSEKKSKRQAYHDKLSRQLQGKAAGVQITAASGLVGNGTTVKIRGIASVKQGKEPLYIVDGVPIEKYKNAVIAKISPDKIEKVNVYKSARARKLFGNIAKDGCVVITTKSGKYRVEEDENYAAITENQFQKVQLQPLSTFSIDVDKASYSNIRRMINKGQKIDVDAVKIEEMVNYFGYDYPQPKHHPFSINAEVSQTPWNKNTRLVRIGLQGKTYENHTLPASNLTFLIDVSGSMDSANKLPLLKSAFKLLVNQLREKDRVSIVVYAGAAGVVLEPTSGMDKEKILDALDRLSAGGSTAGGAGIKLAYKLAQDHFIKGGNNRVILATDGDFNVGASSDKAMQKLIEEKRKSGVFLSVLGFGMGNYKDSKLETLADKGNGNHAYIDTMQEAQKVFGKEFGGTLYTIAKDVKIQLEFNPAKVQAYRLIGYENRLLADEDFIDDTKDAGELGSGHTVTALYEIIAPGVNSDYVKKTADLKYTTLENNTGFSDELFTVKFRYKKPDGDKSIELVQVVTDRTTEMSPDFKFASAVALFGMQLRKSQFTNNSAQDDVITLAEAGRGRDKLGYRAEFIRLVKTSKGSL